LAASPASYRGLQLYEALVTQAPEHAARMVFLTGGAFTDRTRLFVEQTTRPVLYKPCPTDKLRDVVRTTLGISPLLRPPPTKTRDTNSTPDFSTASAKRFITCCVSW
jgi:hypothetical protein